MDSHNDENQMLLDELLNQHNNKSSGNNNSMTNFLDFYDDIQHSSSVTQNRNSQQQQQQQIPENNGLGQNRFVYPGSNPAMQHEKLAYMNQNQSGNNFSSSFQSNHQNSLDNEMVNASFLDDMFTTSSSQALQQQEPQQQPQQLQQQNMSRADSISVANSYAQSFTDEQIPHDLFRNNLEDQMINFTDDMSSSLGSSIHSDFMNSNFGTPTSSLLNSHNLETINSLTATSYNQNNTFSPSSLRSPSSSVRPSVSYLSTSLRQPSTLSNYNPNVNTNNANVNINTGTPHSRHPSTSAQGAESLLSTSVPKSLSHLSQDEKLRRKRDFHNAVERRRRDLIKQKINELGNLVPPSMLRFDDKGKPVKPNKGIILNKTVDYVRFLLEVDQAQDRKRQQLLNKINELQEKFNNMDIKGMNEDSIGSVSTSATITNSNIPHQIQHIAEGEERIIDSRAYPNPKAQIENDTHGDLHQFLSGDILEAQDNAQMMFGDPSNNHTTGNSNAADYLLEFES
ncbi:bHLH/Zip transcription factor [Maudiozyma exigua]|uniref:BHLH/Zip transcription factor n=1 Tax=Maudiozyma exigua TaxID=34358 RepID=A0A9P6WEK6_MAUEX|nr:bHLH/Zip transcription factor [Kazachstania exigua]